MEGWISLHRKLPNWEWYQDLNTKSLFIHCLLKANHKEKKWRGITIKRGSFITSFSHLSSETGISLQSVRTAIKNLEATGEIRKESTSKNTLITVVNYGSYQDSQQRVNKQATKYQQVGNKQPTTTNNDNNEIINSTTSKSDNNYDLEIKNIDISNEEKKEKKLRKKKKRIQGQIDELKNNKIWIESVCIQNKISETNLKIRLDEFLHFLIASGNDTKDERDLKSHFINWSTSRDRISKKNIKKTYQPIKKNTQGIPMQSFTKNR
jgi:DNA-binding Lrp family transcriptional regulator